MILETIVTTQSADGVPHIAPMGVHVEADGLAVLPFRPSVTLDNLLSTRQAVVNHTDDVRIYAGCLTGRHGWPLEQDTRSQCVRLRDVLAYQEITVDRFEDHPIRPRFSCRVMHEASVGPFRGFNRAQSAVLETAILVSRLHMLPWEKIESELGYLTIPFEKTAGPREREAWAWLMQRISEFRREQQMGES